MQESVCLDCERSLAVPADLDIGEILVCPQCHTELEIVSLSPPKLDWPHDDTYDDWDGDDELYDDDFEDEWHDDDDEWLEDDEDYSWMLAKQKRYQEMAELERRRPERGDVVREDRTRKNQSRNNGTAHRQDFGRSY